MLPPQRDHPERIVRAGRPTDAFPTKISLQLMSEYVLDATSVQPIRVENIYTAPNATIRDVYSWIHQQYPDCTVPDDHIFAVRDGMKLPVGLPQSSLEDTLLLINDYTVTGVETHLEDTLGTLLLINDYKITGVETHELQTSLNRRNK